MVAFYVQINVDGLIYEKGNRGYKAAVQNGLKQTYMRDVQKLKKGNVINYLLCEIFKEHVI